MNKACLLFLIFSCIFNGIQAQTPAEKTKPHYYLILQTGLSTDNVGSREIAAQIYIEYQRQLKKNWFAGLSFEHNTYLMRFPFFKASQDVPLIKSNNSFLCINAYYQIKIPKRAWSVTAGTSIGLMRIAWPGYNTVKPVVNASLTLNVPVSPKVDLQLLPFVTFGNRAYYSPYRIDNNKSYLKLNLFPVGMRIRL